MSGISMQWKVCTDKTEVYPLSWEFNNMLTWLRHGNALQKLPVQKRPQRTSRSERSPSGMPGRVCPGRSAARCEEEENPTRQLPQVWPHTFSKPDPGSWMRDFWHLMLQIRAACRYLHVCTRSRPAISFCCSASILHHSSSSSTASLHPHVVTSCAVQVLPSGSFSATEHCLFVCASPQW